MEEVNMNKKLSGLPLWIVALCAICVPALAQRNTGSIVGIITDSSGAVIGDAAITALNIQTGVVRTEVSNSTGNYRVVSLPPGQYSVTASATGFNKEIQQAITLQVDQDLRVDFTLKPGSVQNTVTVTADAPLVNTENGERGTTLSQEQVMDLPSLNRDVLAALPLLSPGTVLARQQYDNDPPLRFSVNGGRALTQDMVVDGAEALSVNINSWNMNNVPDQDVISEMKFQTNAYAAENGRGTAAINIITKSGTNQFHGGIYDYINNSALDANDFFNKLNQLSNGEPNKVTSSHSNLYGGTLGGPILRNKAFFFMLFERQPNSTSALQISTVPTAAFRQGDFSALCQTGFDATGVCTIPSSSNSSLMAVTIYDPATTTANPNYNPNEPTSTTNTPYLRTPFPNNVIRTSRLNSVATNVLSYLPAPTNGNLLNNEQVVTRGSNVTWRINPRIDYNFSDRHLVFYKLGYVSNVTTSGGIWPGNNPADNSNSTTTVPGWQSTFGDTYTFNPHLISDFRIGFERDSTTSSFPGTNQDYASKIGLPNSNAEQFPVFSFGAGTAGYGGIGPSNSLNQWEQTLLYNESISYIAGRHAFKFGGEIRFNQVNKQGGRSDPSGAFGFTGAYTQPYIQNPAQPLSASMADFLLGYVANYSIDPAVFVWGARKKEGSWFVQDDWKLTPKLTLNLGIRQDIQMSWHEVQNRYAMFSPGVLNTFTPTYAANLPPETVLGGLVYGVTQTNGNKLWNFAPRLGFAWTPFNNTKTVLRGGFGMFISPASTIEDYGDTGQGEETGYSPHAATSTTSQLTPAFLLSAGGPVATLPAHTAEAANNGGAALYIDTGEATPKVYVWSATVARELPAHTVFEASYVGTRGSHLPFERELNQVNAAGTATMENLGVQNPAPYLPYPQNIAISGRYHDANSLYNSMQLKMEEKINRNLDWTIAYTLSKSMDNSSLDPTTSWGGASYSGSGVQNIYDLRSNWARSAFDQRQAFSSSFIYQLPFGPGQKFLNHGATGRIVGGWQVNSVVFGRDGQPVEFSTSDMSYTDNEIGRPNCTGAAFKGHAKLDFAAGGIVNWWNQGAFTVPAPYQFGNCGRDLSSVPGYQEVDLSVIKNTSFPTPLNENTSFQFRAEAFNAMNRTNFGVPNSTALASNSNFGFINSDVNGPRTMTLSLRIIF
jgi:hypothetical protein